MSFSPRPWRRELGIDGWEIYDANGDPVASIGSGHDERDAQEANNSRLIADAPEMYELLKWTQEECTGCHETCPHRRARALLARIDGKDKDPPP